MADPKKLADALTQDQLIAQFNRNEAQAQPWYMKPMDMEGRATFLPFKDTLPGSVMNEREFALPGLLAGAVNAFTAPGRVSTQGFDAPEEALNLATNVFGGGITTGKMMRNPTGVGGTDLALNVWHGTPHEIKGGFDLAKVGTGEGAQSYGHGIYFAESPGVAKSYAQKLADYQSNPEYLAAQKRQQDFSETLAKRYKIDALIPSEEVTLNPSKYPQRVVNAIKKLDELEQTAYGKAIQGNLYKADIPDSAIPMMLDWDKPLSEQKHIWDKLPQNIKNSIDDALENNGRVSMSDALSDYKGKHLYQALGHHEVHESLPPQIGASDWFKGDTSPAQHTSAFLESLGVPGVRYFDQGSRKKGEGTSNFVVFKPETVEILEKNGIPTRKELLQQEFDKLDK